MSSVAARRGSVAYLLFEDLERLEVIAHDAQLLLELYHLTASRAPCGALEMRSRHQLPGAARRGAAN